MQATERLRRVLDLGRCLVFVAPQTRKTIVLLRDKMFLVEFGGACDDGVEIDCLVDRGEQTVEKKNAIVTWVASPSGVLNDVDAVDS